MANSNTARAATRRMAAEENPEREEEEEEAEEGELSESERSGGGSAEEEGELSESEGTGEGSAEEKESQRASFESSPRAMKGSRRRREASGGRGMVQVGAENGGAGEEGGGEAATRVRGRSQKKRSRLRESEEEENRENVVEEDEEEDANADLSLRIVAKAEQRKKKKKKAEVLGPVYRVDDDVKAEIRVLKEEEEEEEGMVGEGEEMENSVADGGERGVAEVEGAAAARGDTPEEGELREDEEGFPMLAMELGDVAEEEEEEGRGEGSDPKKSKKRRKKEKKEKKREKAEKKAQRRGEAAGAAVEAEGAGVGDAAEVKDGQAEESLAMRKLLRGPRYFDPPEEQGELCFNCGARGHFASACTEAPRLRPCYVCGGFGHDGRECPQKTECYVCGRIGHIARNCPNKGEGRSSAIWEGESVVCLLCGRAGHEASSCYHSYDERDLERVQCYMCREFGHLCCAVVVDSSPYPISCFDCGDVGHTGGSCSRSRRGGDRGPVSVCYKCGEEGHYARACSRRSFNWPAEGGEPRQPSPVNDRFLPRQGGRTPRWMDIQQREPRWTPSRADRWKGPSRFTFDSVGAGDVDDEDVDGYMGPIERFASNDSFRKRRKGSWASTPGRARG